MGWFNKKLRKELCEINGCQLKNMSYGLSGGYFTNQYCSICGKQRDAYGLIHYGNARVYVSLEDIARLPSEEFVKLAEKCEKYKNRPRFKDWR